MTTRPGGGNDGGLGVKDTAEFVRLMLDSEVAHRDRLEQRASSLVASTGGLVTVTGAAGAFIPRTADMALPDVTLYLFFVALGFFVVAIALSLISGLRGADKGAPVPSGQLKMAMQSASSSPEEFAHSIIRFYGDTVPEMRRWNKMRAAWLMGAAAAQMIAVVALALAVGFLLRAIHGSG